MRPIKHLTYILLLFFCTFPVHAKTIWNAENIQMPFLTDSTQYLADPDNYISKALKDSANLYLSRLRLECGVENTFVIVGKVENADVFRMTQDLGNKYGIGNKKTRKGLVVVVSIEDHRYFIATGMGLEEKLTDADCNDIAQTCIVLNMKRDDPSRCVYETSKALYNKIKTGVTGVESIDNKNVTNVEDWFLIIFLTILIFGYPLYALIRYILQELGVVKKKPKQNRHHHRQNHDDGFPPIFFGGFGSGGSPFHGNNAGSSFGGGSFGGGGSGGSW